ncbi:hypothetical protein [Ferrimicrobium sp.]|uniref:hypothetical protein n=1 Tax=Ferrimicrobium sp. TaxID=2926050 RepID=UPI00260DAC47|nr:hypothetical protein [Ferrimicrobium sp.]
MLGDLEPVDDLANPKGGSVLTLKQSVLSVDGGNDPIQLCLKERPGGIGTSLLTLERGFEQARGLSPE